MIRLLALVPIVLMAAGPSAILPAPAIVAASAAAGLLSGAGLIGRIRPLVTAGAALALALYTLALWVTSARASLLGAIGFGVILALVLDGAEFAGRFHGAALTSPALRAQARHWMGIVVLGGVAALALAVGGGLVRMGGPPTLYPLLAAGGALAAVGGVVGMMWRREGAE